MTGSDVEELQRLLASYHPGDVDGEFGPYSAAAVKRAKWALGYPTPQCDSSAGPKLVAYLKGAPLPPDYQARQAARQHDAAKETTIRDQIVANARWGIAHETQIHYQQLRPMDGLNAVQQLPLQVDCSAFSTLCYAWAGAPDPNGLAYNGQGFTGTMLDHMIPIPLVAAQPGDLVVWGKRPGHHVALVLANDGHDPLLCSHGQEKGPLEIRFSVECKYQPTPARFLALPDWRD
jgi:Putative peptidoglycan binding domain